ncbi:hypothetical protein Peur_052502 [Populus x canadensis]
MEQCHSHELQNLIGYIVEQKVSDQNFVEEHQGEELTCIHMLKSLKQRSWNFVVPFTKSSTRNASSSTASQLSSRKAYALTLSKESIKKFLRENPIKLFSIGCMYG